MRAESVVTLVAENYLRRHDKKLPEMSSTFY